MCVQIGVSVYYNARVKRYIAYTLRGMYIVGRSYIIIIIIVIIIVVIINRPTHFTGRNRCRRRRRLFIRAVRRQIFLTYGIPVHRLWLL